MGLIEKLNCFDLSEMSFTRKTLHFGDTCSVSFVGLV